jgi:DNA-binding PadR family transcriptional regulator
MQDSQLNAESVSESDDDQTVRTLDIHPTDLTQFQLDLLAVMAEDARKGTAIMARLRPYYGTDINHGRTYPNLDTLIEMGLADKRALDQRTNEYSITDEGRYVLRERVQWLGGVAGLFDGGVADDL